MNELLALREDGFYVSLGDDGAVILCPASSLTKKHRDFIKANIALIKCELQLEKVYLCWHVVTDSEDKYLYVVPRASLSQMLKKFPKATVIEPAESQK